MRYLPLASCLALHSPVAPDRRAHGARIRRIASGLRGLRHQLKGYSLETRALPLHRRPGHPDGAFTKLRSDWAECSPCIRWEGRGAAPTQNRSNGDGLYAAEVRPATGCRPSMPGKCGSAISGLSATMAGGSSRVSRTTRSAAGEVDRDHAPGVVVVVTLVVPGRPIQRTTVAAVTNHRPWQHDARCEDHPRQARQQIPSAIGQPASDWRPDAGVVADDLVGRSRASLSIRGRVFLRAWVEPIAAREPCRSS